jgi:hypothetical protein
LRFFRSSSGSTRSAAGAVGSSMRRRRFIMVWTSSDSSTLGRWCQLPWEVSGLIFTIQVTSYLCPWQFPSFFWTRRIFKKRLFTLINGSGEEPVDWGQGSFESPHLWCFNDRLFCLGMSCISANRAFGACWGFQTPTTKPSAPCDSVSTTGSNFSK